MNLTIEHILFRLILAVVIGGIIGYEREYSNRTAGFRTHILVCMGAAIVSLTQIRIGNDILNLVSMYEEFENVVSVDYGRLGAQVISGIGFLGAGTIIHTKGNIKGLTTAASLWIVACIGLAIGMGYYEISILGCVFIVIILVLLKRVEVKFIEKSKITALKIKCTEKEETNEYISRLFKENLIDIKGIEYLGLEDGNEYSVVIYTIVKPRYLETSKLLIEMCNKENIVMVKEIELYE